MLNWMILKLGTYARKCNYITSIEEILNWIILKLSTYDKNVIDDMLNWMILKLSTNDAYCHWWYIKWNDFETRHQWQKM